MISNRTNPEALALAKNFFKSQKRDISDLFERTFEGSTSVPDATILFNNHTGLADKLVFPAQLYTEISFRTIALQNRGHISHKLFWHKHKPDSKMYAQELNGPTSKTQQPKQVMC